MTGINQGRPEVAIGEPIRLGSNNEFEIEQHPVSDRLIIRDTVNGKVAYVRKERGGQIGGDGVLVKALKEGKPVADDGRTHDTIQQAERAASGWVFVPPGTFNEYVDLQTEGLLIQGAGYGSYIYTDTNATLGVHESNITIRGLSLERTPSGGGHAIDSRSSDVENTHVENTHIRASDGNGINLKGNGKHHIIGCNVKECSGSAIDVGGGQSVVSHNICKAPTQTVFCITLRGDDAVCVSNMTFYGDEGIHNASNSNNQLIGGNRVRGTDDKGIKIGDSNNCIVFNNRVSVAANSAILDFGTGTILDGNLTGASN